jgi:membrane protein
MKDKQDVNVDEAARKPEDSPNKAHLIPKQIKSNWLKTRFLVKEVFTGFIDDNVLKLSAALAYYTIFSLPPLLIIIISLTGIFFGEDAVRGQLFGQINGLVGSDAALQIQETIKNVKLSGKSGIATVLSLTILIFGASRVFAEIQDSINYIWSIQAKPNKGIRKFIKNRLMSFSMIISVGFLLMVGLIVNSVLDVLSAELSTLFSDDFVILYQVINYALVFLIITTLFAVIFKTLPDGKVALKDSLIGAAFTALLFMLGKFVISLYLTNSDIGSVYGTAGSVILILVWVYYSATILYFGAEFTKVYAVNHGKDIVPNSYTVRITKPAEAK